MCSCLRALKTSLAAEFWTFGVCQEDVLENLIEENYSSQVLTKQRHVELMPLQILTRPNLLQCCFPAFCISVRPCS